MISEATRTVLEPTAHVAVQDPHRRSEIVESLRRRGWSVVEQPSNLDLLAAISGVVLGDQPAGRPGMIVVDAIGRGCTGASIADGLRALDVPIPVVLVVERPRPSAPAASWA